MKILLNKSFFIMATLLIATALIAYSVGRQGNREPGDAVNKEPLYWVAPMDPNYKRDQPGKSPMGMDLIPVYEDSADDQDIGTVRISPDVINNLGVRTAYVTRGQMELPINTVGYVQYDEDRLVHIHPRVEGWVEKLHVKAAGDPVEKGEPLYALYSPTLVNAQQEFLLALKRNNPLLVDAAMERLLALQVPQAEIKRLKDSGKVSQTIAIRAPQSGVLDNLNVREGMYVKPGMEMMAIGQLEHIWVIGEVFERQVMSAQVGDAVRMHLDYAPGRTWSGTVDYIYPSLNTQTRTVQVRVHFDNPDGYLRPGMFAQMVIATQPTEETLLIPGEALIRTGNQSRVVLAKGNGRFKSIEVEVGRIGENQVEVLSGLSEGEQIVTSAQFLIDSESSKTSDFRRMSHSADKKNKMENPAAIWVDARIEKVMAEHQMLTLAHNTIEAWQWSAMTTDITVDSTVDLTGLEAGMSLRVQIRRDGDNYIVSQIHRPQALQGGETMSVQEQPSGKEEPAMDHSQHSGAGKP